MVRLLAVFATLMLATSFSVADDDKNPAAAGTKGTVTAWDESNTVVLEHKFCLKTRHSWDYVSCGSRLRDRVKLQLCAARGPGTHRYLYQIGDARPTRSTVYCRKS
jgi:hypothetical protein